MEQFRREKAHSRIFGLLCAYRIARGDNPCHGQDGGFSRLQTGIVRPKTFRLAASILIAGLILLVFAITSVRAQDSALMPGDAVVAGCSGSRSADVPLTPGGRSMRFSSTWIPLCVAKNA